MKLKFKTPSTPNYVRTDLGAIALRHMEKEDVDAFLELWNKTFRDKWDKEKRIKRKKKRC